MPARPVIVWFRQDLRLEDNVALMRAAEAGVPVIPLYVFDDETAGDWAPGGATRWWLHHSLEALSGDLRRLGAQLILLRGRQTEVVPTFVREVEAGGLYFNRRYEPWALEAEKEIHEIIASSGGGTIEIRRFCGGLLKEPGEVCTQEGTPYKVYTPFWRALNDAGDVRKPLKRPEAIKRYSGTTRADKLADWGLLPTKPDWAAGLRETWIPGESGAQDRLDCFLDGGLASYAADRNRPDFEGTSRLSPHLQFGEISPAAVWHTAKSWAASHDKVGKGLEVFLKELAWRDFSAHLLYHFPSLPFAPLREEFERYPWRKDKEALRAWQRGRTGYPFVDAGMRQLWRTGWMHNRVRMVVASFLIKDLMIEWREGEKWFWNTLVDADLANNAASWQWVAGCGADAAPYFRIFNPVKQGEKFDPEGTYVRAWVPEIAKLPDEHIHCPWEAPNKVLQKAGIELGKTYPRPLVDHSEARQRALAGYERVKN
jgi:deoxyribodipyrimidine photo-lyase